MVIEPQIDENCDSRALSCALSNLRAFIRRAVEQPPVKRKMLPSYWEGGEGGGQGAHDLVL